MYYPFLRGKQYELKMLRELAEKIAVWGFVPIIEPVKRNFGALKRALEALVEHECKFILIGNPSVGELAGDNTPLWSGIFNNSILEDYDNYTVGLKLTASDTLITTENHFRDNSLPTSVIHWGASEGNALSTLFTELSPDISEHLFVSQIDNILYRNHFSNGRMVLVQDGFNVQRNRDYPDSEPFSDLHLTYPTRNFDGFGDFLTVGSEYNEGGGQPYAVAIHITYSNPDADNALAVKHFISDRVDTPGDAAGKFLEALNKLHADVQSAVPVIYSTSAVQEFLSLFEDQHFPNLGYVKKLSMKHHIELMAHVLNVE